MLDYRVYDDKKQEETEGRLGNHIDGIRAILLDLIEEIETTINEQESVRATARKKVSSYTGKARRGITAGLNKDSAGRKHRFFTYGDLELLKNVEKRRRGKEDNLKCQKRRIL